MASVRRTNFWICLNMLFTIINMLRHYGWYLPTSCLQFQLWIETIRFRPYDVRLWQAQGMCYKEIGRYEGIAGLELRFTCSRYREAIECLKRALIGADPHEITINLKLAKLHHKLEEYNEAVAYNRRVVEVCQLDRTWFSRCTSSS